MWKQNILCDCVWTVIEAIYQGYFFQKAITNLDTQGKLQKLGLLQLIKVRVIFKR